MVSKRIKMQCPLQERQEQRPFAGERTPNLSDFSQLANLIFAAFKGSIDEEQVDILNTEAEVRNLFAGAYGDFLTCCSRVVEVEGKIVSAVLITLWKQYPLVAFAMTCPAYQHKGLARRCLLNSMSDVVKLGYLELHLMVSADNLRAVNLYRSLGFLLSDQREK